LNPGVYELGAIRSPRIADPDLEVPMLELCRSIGLIGLQVVIAQQRTDLISAVHVLPHCRPSPDRSKPVIDSDTNDVSVGGQVLAEYCRGSLPLIEVVSEHSCDDTRTDSKLDPRVSTY
jgi:hypothetical protein